VTTPRPNPPPVAPAAEPWWSAPIELRRTAGGVQVRIRWTRLLLLLAGLAVAGWIGTATGLFLWVKYWRGFTAAQFTDILLPNRWKGYAVARGNFYIEQAKTEIQNRKWGDAIYHLRVGVGASPENTDGRLTLAQCFVLFDRVELAKRVLLDGVVYNRDNLAYLRALFGFLLRYQEDADVMRIARELLPPQPVVTERNQLIALGAAEAHFFRGNFAAAEELVTQFDLLRAKDGQLLKAQIDWDRGNRDAALDRLRARVRETPADDDYYNQLAGYYRPLGRADELERFALLREIGNPRNAAARIEMLRLRQPKAAPAEFQRSIDQFLADFGDNANALLDLGNFAIEIANPALARRAFDQCVAKGLDAGSTAVMAAEAQIAAGDPRAALAFVQELNRDHPEWFARYQGILNGMQAVACYALGQRSDGDLYLTNFLAQPSIRSEFFVGNFLGRPGGRSGFLVALANRLLAAGAREEARRVLAVAESSDPRNQTAITQLIELDLQLGRSDDLALNLHRLLTMRRPSPALLRTAQTLLSGDRYLFSPERDELLEGIGAALAADPAGVSRAAPVPPS